MNTCGWYSKSYVLWNIAEQLWDRELSIHALRKRDGRDFHQKSITATSLLYLKHRFVSQREEMLDIYTSLSVYDLTPILGATAEAKTQFFADTVPHSWIVAFDFDSKDIKQSARDTAHALEFLVKYYPFWKYSISFSGGKGFHIETDQQITYKAGMDLNRAVAGAMIHDGLLSTDTAIYTPRREWRCPHTIHHSGKVKLPMTMTELTGLIAALPDSLEWLTPHHVLQRYQMKNRGLQYISPQDNGFNNELKKLIEAAK